MQVSEYEVSFCRGVIGDEPHVGKNANQKNPLLVRYKLGRAKAPTHDLPGDHFRYGRPSQPNAEPIKALISSWKEYSPRAPPVQRPMSTTDFVKLNKESVKERVTTPKRLAEYRRSHSSPPRKRRTVLHKDIAPQFDDSHSYGSATPVDTPLKALIEHKFEKEWLDTRLNEEGHKSKRVETEKFRRSLRSQSALDNYVTRVAPRVQTANANSSSPNLWKLKQFENMAPRVLLPSISDGRRSSMM